MYEKFVLICFNFYFNQWEKKIFLRASALYPGPGDGAMNTMNKILFL